MSIPSLLVHRVNLQMQSTTKGAHGEIVKTFADTDIAVPCRIRPLKARKLFESGKDDLRVTHRIYFPVDARTTSLDTTDRVRFGARYFELTGSRTIDELGRYVVVDAKELVL